MCSIEETMLELLATMKAKLDAGLVDTVFKVSHSVLLRTKELLDAADISKLRQWWDRGYISPPHTIFHFSPTNHFFPTPQAHSFPPSQ